MKNNYTTCDICDKKIGELGTFYHIKTPKIKKITNFIFSDKEITEDIDICEKCWDKLQQLILNHNKNGRSA